MQNIEEVRAYFAADRFAAGMGVCIEQAAAGCATCSVEIRPEHRNALGSAQGGFIYSLADFTFAVAANSEQPGCVTLSATIQYLRAPRGQRLIATAQPLKQGVNLQFYQVRVTDELGTQVAELMLNGYRQNSRPAAEEGSAR